MSVSDERRQRTAVRVPVGAASSDGCPVAICDDGAVFVLAAAGHRNRDRWVALPPVPGTPAAVARAGP